MKFFYLIGERTEKSLSPYIHTCVYKFLNINSNYKNKNIEIMDFNIKVPKILSDINLGLLDGVNVTNPYKTKIISNDIELSQDALKINAVNCIYKNGNNLIGENTDWFGFIKSLIHNKIVLKDYDIQIIGAGGAARAVIYSLQSLGIKKIQVYNRTSTTLIVNEIKYITLDLNQITNNSSKNIFLVNCIGPDIVNNILTDEYMKSICFFYDLNYHKTQFHDILERKNIKVILGLDMLIYQAIKSMEIWFDNNFIDKVDIEKIKLYLKKKSLC